MSRPKFKELAYMLGVYSNKTIPQTYINEFSNYELLLALLHKINEVIETVNGYNEVMNEIQALLDDLDDEIKAEVKRLLQEMYDSGEFEDVLYSIASRYFASVPVNAPIDFNRIYRRNYNIGDNYRYQTIEVRPSHVQSGTYIESYNGIPYYIYCIIQNGVYKRADDNNGVIVAVNGNTMQIAGQVAVEMNHMNAVDYNPYDNYIYVAGCESFPNLSSTQGRGCPLVYRIHIDEIIGLNKGGLNKNIADVLTLGDISAYQPVYYTKDLTPFFPTLAEDYNLWTNNISYSNNLPANHIYMGFGYEIYDWNWETDEHERITTETLSTKLYQKKSEYGWTDQTSCISGDYLYSVVFNPTAIIRSNLKTSDIEYIYPLNVCLGGGYYATGEPECCKVCDNGDIYLFTNVDHFQTEYRQFRMVQIFKSNLFKNTIIKPTAYKKEPLTIYVDRNSYRANPDGSSSNPFNTIYEAVTFANNNEVADAMNILMRSNSNFGVEIATAKKIYIGKAPDNNEVGAQNKMEIGGIACSGANNVSLSMLDVHYSYPDSNTRLPAYVYLWQSSLSISNLFINQNTTAKQIAYNMIYSYGVMSGAYSENNGNFTVESGKASGSNGIAWTGSTFVSATNSSFNMHGWATTSANIIA